MKTIIIDTSCVLAVVLGEPVRERLVDVSDGAELFAPDSLTWELGNAFSAMFKKKRLTLKESQNALNAAHQIPIRFIQPNISRALEISYEYNIYAYDAYMLVVSEECRMPLMTLDHSLRSCARSLHLKVLEV
jgi:predicted nucleic acid-binding protein